MKRQKLIDHGNNFADWCDLVFKFGMLLLVLSVIVGLVMVLTETITPPLFGLVCVGCLGAVPTLIAIRFATVAALLLSAIEQHSYKTLRFVQSANPGVDLQIEPDLIRFAEEENAPVPDQPSAADEAVPAAVESGSPIVNSEAVVAADSEPSPVPLSDPDRPE